LRELIEQRCPSCPVITLTEQPSYDQKTESDKIVLVSKGPEVLLDAIEGFEKKDGSGIQRVK
jgi:hypothetical protein